MLFRSNPSDELRVVQFGCDYDLCNSYNIFTSLLSLIEQYYTITPMRNAFQTITTTDESTEHLITSTSTYSTQPTNSSSIKHRFQLFFLLFTCERLFA